jgi:hypothetical protein
MTPTDRGAGDAAPGGFNELVELLTMGADGEDEGRLMTGEAAALIQQDHGWGGLKEAAKQANAEYKTVAERARVVRYYESLLPGRTFLPGGSIVRELMAEFPVLRWTHLRVAKGISKTDPWLALNELRIAVEESMTPQQFKRHIAKQKEPPSRYVFPARGGWTVTITRNT